jgi:hypothetical protein
MSENTIQITPVPDDTESTTEDHDGWAKRAGARIKAIPEGIMRDTDGRRENAAVVCLATGGFALAGPPGAAAGAGIGVGMKMASNRSRREAE